MTQPKAKWERFEARWVANVGPFELVASLQEGAAWIHLASAEPDEDGTADPIWDAEIPVPCDLADLMRLAEAELARRLHRAADTMDGRELVAEDEHVGGRDCSACEECGEHCLPIDCERDGKCARCRPAEKRLMFGVDLAYGADSAVVATIEARTGRLLSEEHFALSSPPHSGKTAAMLEAEEIAQRMGGSLEWLSCPGESGSRAGAEVHGRVTKQLFNAPSEDIYARASREWSRKNPPCSVCGVSPKMMTNIAKLVEQGVEYVPEIWALYGCGCHSLVRGSRDWAIAMMKRGNSVADQFGREWTESEGGFETPECWMSESGLLDSDLVDGWRMEPM
jgi:hypothetical protein